MTLDLEILVAPVAGESPTGPDLCYDSEREQIELAFASSVSVENDEGDKNWRETIGLIEAQSLRTKDLWLAVYLARAAARAGDFERVVLGARYLAALLETYWDDVHPQLDEYGFQGRKTPCESLASVGEFLRYLEKVPLLRHSRLGEYSGHDFVRFADGGTEEDGYGMFRAALDDAAASAEDGVDPLAAVIDGLDSIRDAVRRTDAILIANAGDESGTNFSRTYEAVESIRRAVVSFGPQPAETKASDADADVASEGFASGLDPSEGRARSGERVDTRDDVLRSIDAVIDYYRRREPGSPMPVLLARARDWVNADFLSILADIAPTGMDEVRRVLTSQRSE